MPHSPEANSERLQNLTVGIRGANLDDLPVIVALEQSAPQAAHWTSDHYKARIQSQPETACFLVAEFGAKAGSGQLWGFLCARIIAGEWEIENVVVDPGLRHRGIGSQLIESLIVKWKASGASAILLEVRESNVPARGLYERHGFREVGRRASYYQSPEETAVLYSLK